ncbi:uncharacterized protein LOC102716207 [Oryza brachyantha]|uniref:uncharacterized protein LOC102716207 n=1 Tax=Oryza brachyantha TaxID=4533 RepID=UPI000776446F|nr:uncharacterized protein LOC102716207 [Oryza brachyantha]
MVHEQERYDAADGDSSLGGSSSSDLNLNENQDPDNDPASGRSETSTSNDQRAHPPRGPNRMPRGHYIVTEVAANGKPLVPLVAVKAWRTSCGYIVKNYVPIKFQAWRPNRTCPDLLVVPDVEKQLCWDKLKEKITFPPDSEHIAKRASLQSMGILFKKFKSDLFKKFVAKGETPNFKLPRWEKLADFWDEFVEYKTSKEATEISERNKANSLKNTNPHRLGPGGYVNKEAIWDQQQKELESKGIQPVVKGWSRRMRNYSMARGLTLSEDGGLILRGTRQAEVIHKIVEAYDKSSQGEFVPDRENDELTLALGNKEHPGRTRGVGLVPWKVGFPDSGNSYRSRSRGKAVESLSLQQEITAAVSSQLQARLDEHAALLSAQFEEKLQNALSQMQANSTKLPSPAGANLAGLRKNSCASTEHDVHFPSSFPVDEITKPTSCKLHIPWKHLSKEVAAGMAYPCEVGQVLHGCPLPDGYGRVDLELVRPQYLNRLLDIPPEDNVTTLGQAVHYPIAWLKQYIVLDDDDEVVSSPAHHGGILPVHETQQKSPTPHPPPPPQMRKQRSHRNTQKSTHMMQSTSSQKRKQELMGPPMLLDSKETSGSLPITSHLRTKENAKKGKKQKIQVIMHSLASL